MKLRKRNRVTVLAILFTFFFGCVAYAGPGGFTYTGNLNNARVQHTATLLNTGTVLVAGGQYVVGRAWATTATSELYNPTTGNFTTTGSLQIGRYLHTATLLNSGNVLVIGGRNGSNVDSATAEIYNPAAGAFAATGSMQTPREYHTATLLNNGMVLIAGGYCNSCGGTNGALATAELYDPATGTFTPTGNLSSARYGHTATLLNNGMVLIAGGNGLSPQNRLSSAELYNPSTGTFSATASLNTARYGHTATLLNNGMALISGGAGAGSGILSSAELYNPVAGSFSVTGSLATARVSHNAVLLNNGLVLIVAGRTGSSLYTASVELYDPGAGAFTATGNLNTARGSGTTATLLGSGLVLVAAGSGAVVNISTAELYQPVYLTPNGLLSIRLTPVNAWLPIGSSFDFNAIGTFGGSITQTLASVTWSSSNSAVATITNDASNHGHAFGVSSGSATITACAGSVCASTSVTAAPHSNLILGSKCGDASDGTFEIYDDAGNLKQTGNFSTLVIANHSATPLQNGTVFVAGGNGSNCTGSSATWEIVSPSGQILSSGLLQNGRNSPASTLLQNGNVFLAGGQASPTSFDGTWEIRGPTGAFVASGLLNDVRGPGVTAVTLQNGNVWVSGSSIITGSACTYEIHSPTGALVASGSLQSCFAGAQVQALSNGNVMLLGGDNAPGTYEIRAETGAFVSTGSLVSAFNEGASSVLLNNGNVFIFGSCAQPGQSTKFDPDNPPSCPSPGAPSTWEIRNQNGGFIATGSLFDQRAGAGAAVLSNGNIFITGGGLCPSCWEIWTQNGQFVNLGSLFDTRYGGHTLTHF